MTNYWHVLKIICATLTILIVGNLLTTAQNLPIQAPQLQSINSQAESEGQTVDLGVFIGEVLKQSDQGSSASSNVVPIESNSTLSVNKNNSNSYLDSLFESIIEPKLNQPPTLVNYAPSTDLNNAEPLNYLPSTLNLAAQLAPGGKILNQGVTWRVFSTSPNYENSFELIETSEQATPEFQLNPGKYIVSASYGLATKISEISIPLQSQQQTLILDAGGLKLTAIVDQDDSIPNGKVEFDIYSMEYDDQGERILIAKDIQQGQVISLNTDTYHIVSRYGEANAVVNADIQIQPGKLIEAKMLHSAAEITLKLVNEPAGEALIGTNWSVRSGEGEVIAEGNGAFPSHILATGEYEVEAEHRGKNFTKYFTVEAGNNRVVEVIRVN